MALHQPDPPRGGPPLYHQVDEIPG